MNRTGRKMRNKGELNKKHEEKPDSDGDHVENKVRNGEQRTKNSSGTTVYSLKHDKLTG